MDKKALRAQLIEQRLNLPDRLQRMEALQRVLRIFLVDRTDTVIGVYWPIKGEFDALPALYRWQEDALLGHLPDHPSTPIFDLNEPFARIQPAQSASDFIASLKNPALLDIHSFSAGPSRSPRKIGLPVVNKEKKTLTFHAWWPGCPMENDAYDIPKPKDTEVIVPTLLLVPCVGYTDGGYRLGYGGGFYDRTLASLQPKPFTVGLGYANGYSPKLEPEPHDVPLDAILTDEGQAWHSSR
jgi:5-formyltetrahydrofolate cyclo-ligase